MSHATEKQPPIRRRRRPRTTPTTETFGQRLRRLRKAKGFTQTELGEAVGLSQRMLAYYESETDRPPATLLTALAEVLEVSVDELLGRTTTKGSAKTPPQSLRLWRRLRQVERLREPDRKRVLDFIEILLQRDQAQAK